MNKVLAVLIATSVFTTASATEMCSPEPQPVAPTLCNPEIQSCAVSVSSHTQPSARPHRHRPMSCARRLLKTPFAAFLSPSALVRVAAGSVAYRPLAANVYVGHELLDETVGLAYGRIGHRSHRLVAAYLKGEGLSCIEKRELFVLAPHRQPQTRLAHHKRRRIDRVFASN